VGIIVFMQVAKKGLCIIAKKTTLVQFTPLLECQSPLLNGFYLLKNLVSFLEI